MLVQKSKYTFFFKISVLVILVFSIFKEKQVKIKQDKISKKSELNDFCVFWCKTMHDGPLKKINFEGILLTDSWPEQIYLLEITQKLYDDSDSEDLIFLYDNATDERIKVILKNLIKFKNKYDQTVLVSEAAEKEGLFYVDNIFKRMSSNPIHKKILQPVQKYQ